MIANVPTLPSWFHQLNEGIILIEAGRVTAINKTAAVLLELELGQAIGRPLIGVLRDHRLEEAYLKKQAISVETRGKIILASPLEGGLSLQDVSDIKRSQETARELLAVLSHELRTPVSIMRSTFEALRGNPPDRLKERFLARAETESDRLVRLLEDLTVDVKPPQYRTVVLKEVTERAISLVQRTFAEHNVSLEQQVDELTVWADADKLLQIIINLLENAAIHGPDSAAVRLLAYIPQADTAFAHIIVQDQGEPLAPQAIAPLFEPHSRGQSAKAKGTGLGLYIVRSIAEKWHGQAWGKPLASGNEFGVSVPLKNRML